ncbi:Gfo/Idh/MocA family oxidoreductase [Streptomyces erythrochromogenes]|uniref:Gfo/Idh/MocA family oxidoreductase n=1 Tax=Streptomyces erythrochromogenes TaxID=285574 RepID=UPI003431AD38
MVNHSGATWLSSAPRNPAATTCVIVGHGVMGRIQGAKLAELGVRTVAVVDPRQAGTVLTSGVPVVGSLDEVRAPGSVALWSICTPTDAHAAVFRQIGRLAPEADVIVEKPVCVPGDVPQMCRLLDAHRGRVCVDEHYLSSAVPEAVAAAVLSVPGAAVTRVVVEMTKHRGFDRARGRFEDRALGALGYEGPHLLAVLDALGRRLGVDLAPASPATCAFDGEWGPDGSAPQDGAEVSYRTATGCEVVLHTSLVGRPRLLSQPSIPYGSRRRHRVLQVEATDRAGHAWKVAGAFAPAGLRDRDQGTLIVLRDRLPPTPPQVLYDDPLGRHLRRILRYFAGSGPNPAPARHCMGHVALLHQWVSTARAAAAGTGTARCGPRPERKVMSR